MKFFLNQGAQWLRHKRAHLKWAAARKKIAWAADPRAEHKAKRVLQAALWFGLAQIGLILLFPSPKSLALMAIGSLMPFAIGALLLAGTMLLENASQWSRDPKSFEKDLKEKERQLEQATLASACAHKRKTHALKPKRI